MTAVPSPAVLEFDPDPVGLVGETVAERFVVERGVAAGGFGVVYRARHVGLGRAVALKVLRAPAGLAGAEAAAFRRGFEAEAQIIARLEHPNIVTVYDFGVSQRPLGEPLHWIALEWLEGRTLEALMVERRASAAPRFEPAEALALLRPVLEAMAFAHARGIAHRDLKPGNIFLQEQAGKQVPKVLDFGIARMMAPEEEASGSVAATTRTFPAFSPDYAAPEQVTHGRTGPWTDVHALGLILTELLTDGRAYETPPTGSGEGRFEQVVALGRPTPGSKGIGVGSWERVLVKALARRPADRHPDAGALLADLERALPSGPAGRAAPVRRPPPERSRRAGMATVATVMVTALGAAGLYLSLRPAAPERIMMAVLPFQNLSGDPEQEYFSEGMTEGIIGQLSRLAPERLAVIARTSVSQYRRSQKSVKEIGDELGVEYVLESSVNRANDDVEVEARLIEVRDQTQVWAERYTRALKDVLSLHAEIARAVAAGLRLELTPAQQAVLARTRTVNADAYDAYLRSYHIRDQVHPDANARSIAHLERAIELDPNYAAAYAALSEVYRARLPSRGAGKELWERSRAEAKRAIEIDPGLADGYFSLASVLLQYDWDWHGAERMFRKALDVDPSLTHLQRHPYGQLFMAAGRMEEAIAERKRGVVLSPLSVASNVSLGNVYYHARRYQESIAAHRRAVELDPTAGGPHYYLSVSLAQVGRYSRAIEAARLSRYGSRAMALEAYSLARLGRAGEAQSLLEKMLAARSPGPEAIEVARVYVGLGRHDDAFTWLEKAFQERTMGMILLRTEPVWDPIRADPRFSDLLRRVGMPAGGG